MVCLFYYCVDSTEQGMGIVLMEIANMKTVGLPVYC